MKAETFEISRQENHSRIFIIFAVFENSLLESQTILKILNLNIKD